VKVSRPADAETIDLGDRTLLPGLIDAHVICFCIRARKTCRRYRNRFPADDHGAAGGARRPDGWFTAERDMGTEAPDRPTRRCATRSTPAPFGSPVAHQRQRGDILGGHEDAIGYNPEQRVLPTPLGPIMRST